MPGDGWPSLTNGRKIVLLLALIGFGYLLWQTRPNPARLSGWSGNPFVASAAGAFGNDQQGIVGEAAPIGRGPTADDLPQGNPLGAPNTVMTQGYGVGSHAPAHIWGAVDLAL